MTSENLASVNRTESKFLSIKKSAFTFFSLSLNQERNLGKRKESEFMRNKEIVYLSQRLEVEINPEHWDSSSRPLMVNEVIKATRVSLLKVFMSLGPAECYH